MNDNICFCQMWRKKIDCLLFVCAIKSVSCSQTILLPPSGQKVVCVSLKKYNTLILALFCFFSFLLFGEACINSCTFLSKILNKTERCMQQTKLALFFFFWLHAPLCALNSATKRLLENQEQLSRIIQRLHKFKHHFKLCGEREKNQIQS